MIKLRGHHLLCSITFNGYGYSRAFEHDFCEAIRKIKKGETILIVDGPDDLCRSVKNHPISHCYKDRIGKRDKLALQDFSKIFGKEITSGSEFNPVELFDPQVRKTFKSNEIRTACFNCQWQKLCDKVASQNFHKSILFAEKGREK